MGRITIGQLALICWRCFLSLFFFFPRRVSLFMCLLVYRVCPLLLISSALILCFTAAGGAQNVRVRRRRSVRAHSGICPGCQVSPTMLMRSKFNCSSPHPPVPPPHPSLRRVTIISTLYPFILPPRPSITQVHLSLITPVIFVPLSLFLLPSLHSFPSLHSLHLSLIICYFCHSCPSQSNTSLVLSNFPCPRWVFFCSFFSPPPLLSSPSFVSLSHSSHPHPPSPPNFCHPRLITIFHFTLLSVQSSLLLSPTFCSFLSFTLLLSHPSFFALSSASTTHLSFIPCPSSSSPLLSRCP